MVRTDRSCTTVADCLEATPEHFINLTDNMLLSQPKGMQAFLQHKVLGVMTPYIRWVITVREVIPDLLRSASKDKGKYVYRAFLRETNQSRD